MLKRIRRIGLSIVGLLSIGLAFMLPVYADYFAGLAYTGVVSIGSNVTGSYLLIGTSTNGTYLSIGFGSVTAPSIVATNQTGVTITTARLNSRVISDGGEASSVRFGIGTSSQTAANFTNYTLFSAWATGYSTNSTPYYDQTGLSINTTYYYRAQIMNSYGTVTSTNEVSFTTTASLGGTANLRLYPSNTSIELWWDKSSGSTNTTVRYRTDTYPVDISDGTLAYNGGASHTTVTGLTAGTTYYFAIWGWANPDDTTPSTGVMTTNPISLPTGGADSDGIVLPTPTLPATAMQNPDSSGFQLEPFTSILKYFTSEGLGMPEDNAWEFAVILGMVIISFIIYGKTKNIFIAFGTVLILTVFFTGLHLVQWYLIPIELLIGGGVWALEKNFL